MQLLLGLCTVTLLIAPLNMVCLSCLFLGYRLSGKDQAKLWERTIAERLVLQAGAMILLQLAPSMGCAIFSFARVCHRCRWLCWDCCSLRYGRVG